MQNDLTKGPVLKLLIDFSIPIFIGNIFQQFYNLIDTAIIGNVLGQESLAAIGSTSAIFLFVVWFCQSLTNGFCIIVSRSFGSKDPIAFNKSINATYKLSILVSILGTIISLLILKPILVALKTPSSIIQEANDYLFIIFAFLSVMIFYNLLASLLRSIGNSKTPLIALIIATLVNTILDIVFVRYLNMGIKGAAYATIIAQFVSVLYCSFYIQRYSKNLSPQSNKIKPDSKLFHEMLSLGFSMAFMSCIVQMGSFAMQISINNLGYKSIAAFTTGRKIEQIFMMLVTTFGSALSTFTSQNFGAKKFDRIKEGIKYNLIIILSISVLCYFISLFFGKNLSVLICGTTEDLIINEAILFLNITTPFMFSLGFLVSFRGVLQGLGKKLIPLSTSIVELAVKFIAVFFIQSFIGICWLEPIIWLIGTLIIAIYLIYIIKRLYNK